MLKKKFADNFVSVFYSFFPFSSKPMHIYSRLDIKTGKSVDLYNRYPWEGCYQAQEPSYDIRKLHFHIFCSMVLSVA